MEAVPAHHEMSWSTASFIWVMCAHPSSQKAEGREQQVNIWWENAEQLVGKSKQSWGEATGQKLRSAKKCTGERDQLKWEKNEKW